MSSPNIFNLQGTEGTGSRQPLYRIQEKRDYSYAIDTRELHAFRPLRQLPDHLRNLGLIVPKNCVCVSCTHTVTDQRHVPALPLLQSTVYPNDKQSSSLDSASRLTTGGLNFFGSAFSFFIASASSFAPSTKRLAFFAPTYSNIDLIWSPVGASSVTLSSNSVRWNLL